MEPILTAQGINGQIALYEHFVVITRKGVLSFMTHGFDGGKFIFLKAITGLQYKAAGKLTSGFLQIVFQGSGENKNGLFSATSDENTIVFGHDHNDTFKRLLEQLLNCSNPHTEKGEAHG